MYFSRTCFLFFPSLQCEDIHTDTQIHSLFIFTMVQTFITWLHHKDLATLLGTFRLSIPYCLIIMAFKETQISSRSSPPIFRIALAIINLLLFLTYFGTILLWSTENENIKQQKHSVRSFIGIVWNCKENFHLYDTGSPYP